jgi:hypothetical protein
MDFPASGITGGKRVADERAGTQTIYPVAVPGIVMLGKFLDAMWARAFGDFVGEHLATTVVTSSRSAST